MKRKIKISVLILVLSQVFFTSAAFTQPYDAPAAISERYELVLFSGYSSSSTSYRLAKLPVVVLDAVMGIVWRCDNIEDSNPRWIKTDLGRNADKPLSAKRYVIQVSYLQISTNKIPAIVLDTEIGKVWTCPNILDQGAPWVPTDLVKEIKEERRITPPRY